MFSIEKYPIHFHVGIPNKQFNIWAGFLCHLISPFRLESLPSKIIIYYLQSKEKKTWLENSSQTMIGNFQSKTDSWQCSFKTFWLKMYKQYTINAWQEISNQWNSVYSQKTQAWEEKTGSFENWRGVRENQMNFIRDLTPLWTLKSATAFKNFGKCCTFMTT